MGEAAHILVVDDDTRIRNLLVSYLQGNGFRVTPAAHAAEARRAMESLAFDVVVLDVMMPGENGFDFAAALRKAGNTLPVLMLSARAEAQDRIQGLSAGSDDYLVKPFEPEELLLRLRNLLRRAAPLVLAFTRVRFGDCVFDLDSGTLERDGEHVRLTSREKDILRQLAAKPGETFSRADLQAEEGARAIDVQMTRLRQKIEKDPSNPVHLQTVRGQGYSLFAEPL